MRAQKAQQDYLKNFIVGQNLWGNGPVKKILRDRVVSKESQNHDAFGPSTKTDFQRVAKVHADHPIDAVPVRIWGLNFLSPVIEG